MIGARIGAKIGCVVGARIGVGIDQLGGSASMSSVTKDATSGIYVPQNLTEWNTTLSVAGISSGAPLAHWDCQAASGNLADNISSIVLTVAGTPTYSVAVTGWARKAIQMADAATMSFSSTSTSLPDISTTSALIIAIIATTAVPAATRNTLTVGTTQAALGPVNAGPVMRVINNATSLNGADNLPTTPILMALRVNRTATLTTGFSMQDKVSPTWNGSITGKKLSLGPSTGTLNSPPAQFMDVTLFSGTAAEMTDAQIKKLYQTLGWSPSWT